MVCRTVHGSLLDVFCSQGYERSSMVTSGVNRIAGGKAACLFASGPAGLLSRCAGDIAVRKDSTGIFADSPEPIAVEPVRRIGALWACPKGVQMVSAAWQIRIYGENGDPSACPSSSAFQPHNLDRTSSYGLQTDATTLRVMGQ